MTNYKELFKEEPANIQERLDIIYMIFEELQKEHNLYNFKFKINSRFKVTLGQCDFTYLSKKGTIQLAKLAVESGEWIKLIDTLLHEVAHAIDFNTRGTSDHSWRWKKIAVMVGAEPERITTSERIGEKFIQDSDRQAKYTLTCPKCGHKSHAHRKTKRTYGCGTCNANYRRGIEFIPYEIVQNY